MYSAARYRKDLKKLTEGVTEFLARLDHTMKQPSSVERGRKIARLCNALEILNDCMRYGALEINFRTDKKPVREKVLKSLR